MLQAKARAARPDLDLDGFFVKNLETVQGDERDVIILSIGYGPDHRGKLLSTFGPINRDGGWRRLNVAVTRARRRMEVIAFFHGGDLPDSANKSVQHLKRYLQYAQHGPAILRTEATDADAAPESPFEEEVIDVLSGWGYEVQPQVGVAGFRIDMAVRHPGAPGTYALGTECDGAMYHSSRAAGTATGSGKRSCATWGGGCTASGALTGTGTGGMRWRGRGRLPEYGGRRNGGSGRWSGSPASGVRDRRFRPRALEPPLPGGRP